MEKLIRLSETHYIIVDDSEKKVGDTYYYRHFGEDIIDQVKETTDLVNINSPDNYFKKVTYSSQPIEKKHVTTPFEHYRVKELPLSKVEESGNFIVISKQELEDVLYAALNCERYEDGSFSFTGTDQYRVKKTASSLVRSLINPLLKKTEWDLSSK